jgi:hypothetical protein
MAAVVVSALALAAAAAAGQGLSGFQAPSRNIGCVVGEGVLRCDIGQTRARPPRKPASCDLDWGNAFSMAARSRARRLCVGDTVLGGRPVVSYGSTWRFRGFACTVRTVGVRCVNRAGHGWFLSRARVTLF